MDKAWTSAKHLPTPCPHSPPSRPPPHRFNNNDSSQRQLHRHRNLPGLFRHPRQSVDGIVRSNTVRFQRNKVTNNIRAALKPCIAPRLGPNVSLAGEPRLIPKLQPAAARRGRSPARANSFLVQRAVETTTRLPRHQAVTMWTRPPVKLRAGSAHRAPSYRPCGQGVDKCAALDHPFPTLGALASSSSPPRQQSVMRKATSPPASASRTVPSSQEIRLRNIPVKSRGDPTS